MISGLSVVLEVFWKSGVVLGVALCLRGLLRKQSADLRQLVLSTAIIAMLVAAVIFPVLPRWRTVTPSWLSSGARPQTETQVANEPDVADHSVASASALEIRIEPSELRAGPTYRANQPVPLRKQLPGPVLLIWFAGSAFLLARFVISLRGLRRLRKMSDAVTEAGLLEYLNNRSRGIALLQNQSVVAPVTWGIFRPVILLPTGFEKMPDECRYAILRHELAHIQADDFFVRVLSEVARALIWFQPLMWIARRQLREEQEMACDDRVLAEGGKPSTYAKLLLDWSIRSSQAEVSIAVGISQGSCLKRRICALLDQEIKRDAVSRAAMMTTWFLSFATALPLAAVGFIQAAPPVVFRLPTTPPRALVQAVVQAVVAVPVQTAQIQGAPQAAPQKGVALNPNLRGAVVVLVLDKSASMEGQKLELLRAAATAVIDNLRPEDQVGILTFDQAFQWTVPIRKADDKASMKQLISGIYADGGTKIPEALREACEKILPYDGTSRHIVLLTDGISEEGDSQQIAKDAADHKITISTIGLGPDIRRPFLEMIAAAAGGKSYFLNDPNGLEQIMLSDVKEYIGTRAVTAPRLEFEVASVKVHPMAPNSFMMRFRTPGPPPVRSTGNRLTEPAHLQELVMEAYGVHEYQIYGLPDWGQSPGGTVYDIEAKAEGDGTPTTDQLRQMLQSLLADRFQLRLHQETRELPVYALVIGKNGSKLRELRDDEEIPRGRGDPAAPTEKGTFIGLFSLIGDYLDRPLADETGITGRYESASMPWDQFRDERRTDPTAAQDIVFAAVQDKLGLKLEPRKESMEVLVIEHVEQPSPN